MSKILLVSQDTQQKELIVNVLTGAKSSATLITSVDEAAILNYVEKGQVDMVIIDEDTTSPDTVILAKKLHSSAIKENVAVAALVNYDTCNTDLLRLANVYITKPINEKILCSCVNGSLKLKKLLILYRQITVNLRKVFISWMFYIILLCSLQALSTSKS